MFKEIEKLFVYEKHLDKCYIRSRVKILNVILYGKADGRRDSGPSIAPFSFPGNIKHVKGLEKLVIKHNLQCYDGMRATRIDGRVHRNL